MDQLTQAWISDLSSAIISLDEKLDHLHDDVMAMREWMRIPRTACYPTEPAEKEGAERAGEE